MKLTNFIDKDVIQEGYKIGKDLIGSALSDSNIQCGFEVEFLAADPDRERDDEDEEYEERDEWTIRSLRQDLEDHLGTTVEYYNSPDEYKQSDADSDWEINDDVSSTIGRIQYNDLVYFDTYESSHWKMSYSTGRHDARTFSASAEDRISKLYHVYRTDAKQGDLFKNDTEKEEDLTDSEEQFDYLRAKLGGARLFVMLMLVPKTGNLFLGGNSNNEPIDSDQLETEYDDLDPSDLDAVSTLASRLKGYSFNIPVRSSSETYSNWILTTDGSVGGASGDGYEIVSPVQSLKQTLYDLREVFSWMTRNGHTTDSSCGFHVSFSYKGPQSTRQIDVLKLIMLIGEERMLKDFNRLGNNYTASQLTKIRTVIHDQINNLKTHKPEERDIDSVLKTLTRHMNWGEKYYSVNLSKLKSDGYIEFRIMGNGLYHTKFDEIRRNILKIAVSMKIALDKHAYREEYLRKVLALIKPTEKGAIEPGQLDIISRSILKTAHEPQRTFDIYKMYSSRASGYQKTGSEEDKQKAIEHWFKMVEKGLDDPHSTTGQRQNYHGYY